MMMADPSYTLPHLLERLREEDSLLLRTKKGLVILKQRPGNGRYLTRKFFSTEWELLPEGAKIEDWIKDAVDF